MSLSYCGPTAPKVKMFHFHCYPEGPNVPPHFVQLELSVELVRLYRRKHPGAVANITDQLVRSLARRGVHTDEERMLFTLLNPL